MSSYLRIQSSPFFLHQYINGHSENMYHPVDRKSWKCTEQNTIKAGYISENTHTKKRKRTDVFPIPSFDKINKTNIILYDL